MGVNKIDTGPAVSLVIPFYNEGSAISGVVAGLIAEFERERIPCELVLVNNGSEDDTGEIVEGLGKGNKSIRGVHVAANKGYGWGIICGLKETTAPVVGFTCGDGQIAPRDVIRVYRLLIEQNLDLCKVNRVVRQDGLKRLLMSKCYNLLFHLLFSVKSRDVNGAPKLMRRECYRQLELSSRDWFIDAEIMIKASRNSYRTGQVDVIFLPRDGGGSNVGLTTSLEFLRNMLRQRFRGSVRWVKSTLK